MTESKCNCSQAVRDYLQWFENMQPASLAELDRYFAPDVHFKDPFNDVGSRDAVRRIFEHMFKTTGSPRFRIDGWMCAGDAASIRWQFQCELKGLTIAFPGMSFVRFDVQGKAIEHIDYWDPAQGIYEKLPLLGRFMRYLRRRLAIVGAGS